MVVKVEMKRLNVMCRRERRPGSHFRFGRSSARLCIRARVKLPKFIK